MRGWVVSLTKWIIFLALIVVVSWGGCKLMDRGRQLSFVPVAMNVSRILYAAERSGGIGPGANETGIIVYEMPDEIVRQLKLNGIAYLQELAPNTGLGLRRRYPKWHATPVVGSPKWRTPTICDSGRPSSICPGIRDFMFRYLSTPFDVDIEHMVNEAIFKKGSYYAFGRSGTLLILSPYSKRIVFAYNG